MEFEVRFVEIPETIKAMKDCSFMALILLKYVYTRLYTCCRNIFSRN